MLIIPRKCLNLFKICMGMKSAIVLVSALAFMILTSARAQQINRGDLCQSIPGLTTEQQQKLSRLGGEHQKQMDLLRNKYLSENNAQLATELKTQMNKEMQNHYREVSALLTPEQQSWYDRTCQANGSYGRAALARDSGRGLGRGAAYGRGAGYGRGTGYGRGAGYVRGNGYVKGAGYRTVRGGGTFRGRGRCIYN